MTVRVLTEELKICPAPIDAIWSNDNSVSSSRPPPSSSAHQSAVADTKRRDSRCEIESNTPHGIDNAALESYGQGAMCMLHGHKWVQRKCSYKRAFRFYGAGCYTVQLCILW